ncbi:MULTISPECIES: YceI family protein [unclassified Oceanobacter]|jgi:polyisoprenoid-binding protein YceI|uniref:YceI family protein n=2 Tax=Gammaproteobacteria TaxID=1236 RepID=UPI002736E26B|nr:MULTISPECIES: YceI family protein [unclassified Oceanobacter]MDP2504753.1 YceI family protein [Oceanobacter sp. 3_MG-2023]MDP2547372.1 YceI family protein [Oceanobacter sp. 4_MG-2023]
MTFRTALIAPLLLTCLPVLADWQVDNDSVVAFQTTKNINKVENHHFKHVSGAVSSTGAATINIDLSSVATGIDIRDSRMQSMLFDTSRFATAVLQATVPAKVMTSLEQGKPTRFTLSGSLSLHGKQATVTTEVLATPAADASLVVSSLAPVLIDAAEFGLEGGIEALRNIAKLTSITQVVPVEFTLILKPQ